MAKALGAGSAPSKDPRGGGIIRRIPPRPTSLYLAEAWLPPGLRSLSRSLKVVVRMSRSWSRKPKTELLFLNVSRRLVPRYRSSMVKWRVQANGKSHCFMTATNTYVYLVRRFISMPLRNSASSNPRDFDGGQSGTGLHGCPRTSCQNKRTLTLKSSTTPGLQDS